MFLSDEWASCVYSILTRLRIGNKLMKQKSEEFESDQEKIGKYKKLNIYLYFEFKEKKTIVIAKEQVVASAK